MNSKVKPPTAEEISESINSTGRTDAVLLHIMAEDEPTLDAAANAIARTSTSRKKPSVSAVKEQLEGIAEQLDEPS